MSWPFIAGAITLMGIALVSGFILGVLVGMAQSSVHPRSNRYD